MTHQTRRYDAIVVGSGPNGLSAACVLARAGRRVLLIEAGRTLGGAASSAALTLPGFVHDLGSAVHPFAVASPVFQSLHLERYGLRWIQPPVPVAHPLDDGQAVLLERSVAATAAGLGGDAAAYLGLMRLLVRWWHHIQPTVLNPLSIPRYPLSVALFGIRAVWSLRFLTALLFRQERAAALLAGIGGHAMLPLEAAMSAAATLVLTSLAHAVGWPIPQGGAQSLANALVACFKAYGGEIRTDWRVGDIDELPSASALLFDLTPQQLVQIAADRLPMAYRQQLMRFRQGPGVFKLDYALDGSLPWANPACARAATVHIGGTYAEIASSERAPHHGQHAAQPYCLLVQPTLFDPSRAPPGKHTIWVYCHVPQHSTVDMTSLIEAQIERFAPGFSQRILARSAMRCADMQAWNANLIGGDISGGLPDWRQLFARPILSLHPQRSPMPGIYLCSSSTPPGPGVHGMCGYHAAKLVLQDLG